MVWDQYSSGKVTRYLTRAAGNHSSCYDQCFEFQNRLIGGQYKIRYFNCYDYPYGNKDDFSNYNFEGTSRLILCQCMVLYRDT